MEDSKIIDLYWNREEKAISETDEKYGRYLMKIAMNILCRYEDSEECVNDTYLDTWNQIPPTRPKYLLPYIGRITRNKSIGRLQYLTADKRSNEMNVLMSELDNSFTLSDNPEYIYDNKEIGKAISAFLRTCKKEYRYIFIRRYWFSDSIAEISDQLEMSQSKIKSILFRVRNKLRKYLEKEGYII